MTTPIPDTTRHRRALAPALAIALLTLTTAPAHAQNDDGLWYYRDTGVAEAHQTATGEGITVAVIDSPINPDIPELADADLTIHEPSFCDADEDGTTDPTRSTEPMAQHGTTMTALVVGGSDGVVGRPGIQGVAPGAQLLYYSKGPDATAACAAEGSEVGTAAAIDQAVADGAQILNLSFGGLGVTGSEVGAIGRALRAGVIVVAPAGNSGGLVEEWPAVANGVVTVTAIDARQQLRDDQAMQGPSLDVAAPGVSIRTLDGDDWQSYNLTNGSSNATAWTSGVVALAWSAHPEATGNQMIQSLLRNTITGGGELNRVDDYWGYGVVSVRRMLESDPTTYPDVNPLIVDDPDARPTYAELVDEAPAAEPPVTDEPGAGDTDDVPAPADPSESTVAEDTGAGPLIVPVLVGITVLAALGVVVVVVLRRRRTATTTTHHSDDPRER